MEQQLSMNETEIAAGKSGKNAGAAKPVTRAAKARRQKEILRALLEKKPYKWNELLEEAVKEYTAKYPEENADIPDIKGKFGSNFSLMEDAGEVLFDKASNMCSLKIAEPQKSAEKLAEKAADMKAEPKKRGRKPAAKAESKAEKAVEKIAETVQEKEEEKRAAIEESLKKAVEKAVAKAEAAGKKRAKKSAGETAEKPIAEAAEEKPLPKKRGRKPAAKTEVKAEVEAEAKTEMPAPAIEAKAEEKPTEKPLEKPVEAATTPAKQEIAAEEKASAKAAPAPAKNDVKKDVKKDLWLTDFVFLGNASNTKKEEPKTEAKPEPKIEVKVEPKAEIAEIVAEPKTEIAQAEKPAEERKTEPKTEPKIEQKSQRAAAQPRLAQARSAQPRAAQAQTQTRSAQTRSAQSQSSPRTADEKLKEEFLKRLRALSGEYFEYYSVYLLERYSLKSGRRLEGLRISGGKNDGGIDGEIELTDRFGFRETIYIQAKNWDPTKGLAEKWMIGETLVQQFVGAATCRQMRDGKRNCRGIFVTTSSFTKDAKDALEVLGEKFIGYDGNDVFETAKECEFGLIKVNGVWQLDEKLLASDKAFFNMI